jgi:hypothetical protein
MIDKGMHLPHGDMGAHKRKKSLIYSMAELGKNLRQFNFIKHAVDEPFLDLAQSKIKIGRATADICYGSNFQGRHPLSI